MEAIDKQRVTLFGKRFPLVTTLWLHQSHRASHFPPIVAMERINAHPQHRLGLLQALVHRLSGTAEHSPSRTNPAA